jgi:hypothetical protein
MINHIDFNKVAKSMASPLRLSNTVSKTRRYGDVQTFSKDMGPGAVSKPHDALVASTAQLQQTSLSSFQDPRIK